jgi:hypothetical protein
MCDGHSRHATYDPATAGYEISLKTCHNTREAFLSGCCARAASGHAAVAPRRVMNSRRCISSPSSGDGILTSQTSTLTGLKPGSKTIAAVHSQCR